MIWAILIGAAAGYLAGNILRGEGYGAIGNIFLGVLGGFLGDFLFSLAGFSATGIVGKLISATVGAILLVFLFGKRRHGGRQPNN